MSKPIICIDFDGVIHSYEKGWQDGDIYGVATPGFFEWAAQAQAHFKLVVYSSRSKTPEGIAAMKEAIDRWYMDSLAAGENPLLDFSQLEFSDAKPPAFLTIDDRAICFLGDWKVLDPAQLTQFQPWNVFDRSDANNFVNDWNKMIGTISSFSSKWNLPQPEIIYHPKVLDHIRANSYERISDTLIFMGVKIRFGFWEVVTSFRSR